MLILDRVTPPSLRPLVSRHLLFLPILLLHLALSVAYATWVPLGEAPDEPAHLAYARFIAETGRLPASLAERQAASYRSAWPPLYHGLIAGPLAAVGEVPPTRLKAVGDTPRRLIPTNGQTIASFIHTVDEAWPWRGLPLAWHLSRLISVILTALSVMMTYLIGWRLTGRRDLALSAAALHAFIPQVLFIGSVVNDDNLLIFLSGLIFLTLISCTQRSTPPSSGQLFFLGALLGLASIAKYNALPLWGLVIVWAGWITMRGGWKVGRLGKILVSAGLPFLLGAGVTGGWWFIFVWLHFNRVNELGLLSGSLAAFSAGASDASLRHLASGGSLNPPSAATWLAWFVTLFQSFWGRFGGGGTIPLPTWSYWLLAFLCLLAFSPIIVGLLDKIFTNRGNDDSRTEKNTDKKFIIKTSVFPSVRESKIWLRLCGAMFYISPSTFHPPPSTLPLFLLSPLLFLPLPILRFLLSGSIVETAQGRHLFPALPAITLALVWGVSRVMCQVSSVRCQVSSVKCQAPGAVSHVSRFTFQSQKPTGGVSRFTFVLALPPLFVFCLSLYALGLIRASYPPLIPLRTTAEAATAANLLQVEMAEGITLVGYELGQSGAGLLPVTLTWQAEAIPAEDYLIELSLTGEAGQFIGGWLGHPLGGRYPTRAWDAGDVLHHTIPVPLLPNLPTSPMTLTLRLLDSFNQPTTPPLTIPLSLLPSSHARQIGSPTLPSPILPSQLRADELPPDAAFTYRSTLSFVLPEITAPPDLIGPTGAVFQADQFLPGPQGGIAHFIVAANWPSGDYQLSSYQKQTAEDTQENITFHASSFTFHVSNRPRQFEPPPMAYPLNANFAATMTLLGYDLPQHRVQPGESFPLTLHWRAERTLGQNLVVFNHLLDGAAIQRGGADRIPQLYYTTLLWVPGEIVSDAYQIPVDMAAPPGIYWLHVGLYPSGQPALSLPLLVDGQPIDQTSVRLGPLKVGGPPPGLVVTAAQPQHVINQSFGDQITLLGFNLTDPNGNPIFDQASEITNPKSKIQNLKLFWRADTFPAADYTVFVHFLDPAGKLVGQADGPPAAGAYPTGLWEPGEIIVDERSLPDLSPGRYGLQVGLYRPETGERLPVAGSVDGAVRLGEFEMGE